MLSLNFLYAFGLLALAAASLRLELPPEAPFAPTGVFFGGAALICALFAIKHRRHGLIGAGFLSFLALLTGGSRFFTLLRSRELAIGDPQTTVLGVFLALSALYLAATIIRWRTRPLPPPE